MKKLMVLVLALGLVLGMSGLASAGATLSGDLRNELTWAFYDADYDTANSGVGKSYVDVRNFNNHSSRLKVRWASADKKYGAYVEFGVYNSAMSTRRTEFWYNWDGGQIWFGQGYHVMEHYWPNQWLDGGLSLIGYGKTYLGRNQQVVLTLGKKHKLKLAIMAPKKGSVWTGGRTYHIIPALSAAYHMSFGNVNVTPWVNYELVQWENANMTDNYSSLDLGVAMAGDFGLIGFSVALSYGLNSSQSGVPGSSLPRVINNQVSDDVSTLAAWGELRVAGLSVGAGYVTSDRAAWANNPYTVGAYASYKIPFGPMTFRPEIVWLDNGESTTGSKNGNQILVGVFTNIGF